MKRGPEGNNIDPAPQDNTPPELPNDAKQSTSPKLHSLPKRPKYEIRQLNATLQLNRKDKCCMCLSHFVSTKILVSLTLARSRVPCRKQNSGEFSQHIQPPFSKDSLLQSSKSRSPMAASCPSESRCYYDSSLAAKSSKKHSWFSQLWGMYSSECHSSRSTQ